MSKLNLKQVLKTGTLVSLLALSGFSAQARGPGDHGGPGMMMAGPGMMMGGRIEHVLEAVDATDAQRSQIKQIMQSAHNDLKAQREAGHKLRQQGLTLFAATNIDAAAIEALRVQAQAHHEQVSKRMSQALVEAARVLTPEQRAKFAEKMKKRQARMQEHAGGKRGH